MFWTSYFSFAMNKKNKKMQNVNIEFCSFESWKDYFFFCCWKKNNCWLQSPLKCNFFKGIFFSVANTNTQRKPLMMPTTFFAFILKREKLYPYPSPYELWIRQPHQKCMPWLQTFFPLSASKVFYRRKIK